MIDLLGVAVRISVAYVYVLALLRLSGKRSVSSLSPLDFLAALILGDLFDDVFWAEVPLAQGMVAIAVVIGLHTLMGVLEAHVDPVKRLVSGKKTRVIDHARLDENGLSRERTGQAEVFAQLRLVGEDQLEDVREANWETGGQMSVLPTEAADEVRKRDAGAVKALVKP